MEALLGVHGTFQSDAGVLDGQQLLHREVLDDHREGGRCDDVAVAQRLSGGGVDVLRGVGEDGPREFAHLFAAHEIGSGRREDATHQLRIH